MDSPTYPTWYSGTGHMGIHWTVLPILHGIVGQDTWESIGQSYLSYMVQWDRTHGNPLDSPTYPTWDSGIGHMGIHWTDLPILHGIVG